MWKKDSTPEGNEWYICRANGSRIPLYYQSGIWWSASGMRYEKNEVEWFDDSEIVFWHKDMDNPKIIISKQSIVMTCSACPSQWDAKTTDGKEVYIRVRYGHFTMDVDDEEIFSGNPDGVDGVMSTSEMIEYVTKKSKNIFFA